MPPGGKRWPKWVQAEKIVKERTSLTDKLPPPICDHCCPHPVSGLWSVEPE